MFVKHDFTGHDLSKSDLGNFQFLMKYVNLLTLLLFRKGWSKGDWQNKIGWQDDKNAPERNQSHGCMSSFKPCPALWSSRK